MRSFRSAVARPGAVVAAASLTALFGLTPSGPAQAHVEPTSTTGEAGRRAVVGFVPTHGCGSAPTIGIDIRLPDGVLDPLPVDLDGWTSSVDDRVVTWDGGPLPDGDEATFAVDVLLPDQPGATLVFPTIQRCPDDESLAWIQEPGDGTDQSFPAPTLTVVEATGPPGTTSPAPPASDPPATTDDRATADDQAGSPTTASPATSVAPTGTTVPEAILVESESDSGGDELLPLLLVLGGVIVIGAGAIVLVRRRGAS